MNHKYDQAIAALMVCSSQTEAATKAGISEVTLWRWMKKAEFRRQYEDARGQIVEQARRVLQQSTEAAVATLRRNLGCGFRAAENLAAKIILERAEKIIGFEVL